MNKYDPFEEVNKEIAEELTRHVLQKQPIRLWTNPEGATWQPEGEPIVERNLNPQFDIVRFDNKGNIIFNKDGSHSQRERRGK